MVIPLRIAVVPGSIPPVAEFDVIATLMLVAGGRRRVVPVAAQVMGMTRAATPPTGVCTAPKILSATPCRRRVATPGTAVCSWHLGTDPERRCQGEARERSGDRVTCHAWPLVGAPYCAAHDPQELARRRQTRAAARMAMARGRELLTHTPPEILRGALEILLLSGRVSVVDIETAVRRSRWLTDRASGDDTQERIRRGI